MTAVVAVDVAVDAVVEIVGQHPAILAAKIRVVAEVAAVDQCMHQLAR